jgi:trehalose 6-phosphate phosphatase
VRILNDRFEVEGLLRAVRRARNRVLFLDYDGTLAPFILERGEASPYPGVVPLLSQLCLLARHRLVLVSGRPARQLERLLGLSPRPAIFGSYGMEELPPDGPLRAEPVSDDARRIIDHETERLEAALAAGCVERKPYGLAIHVRGLPPHVAAEMLDFLRGPWRTLARRHALTLREFDGGLELYAGTRTKGDVVAEVVSGLEQPVAAAFLGDDETDEDAFRAMQGRGASILVRPSLRPTQADLWLQPPGELLGFLARWRDAAGASA